MDIRIFDLPTDGRGFVHAGYVSGVTSARTTERFYSPGWVEVSLPTDAARATALSVGRIMQIDGSTWGIIEDVRRDEATNGHTTTVSGVDIKGIVNRRVCVPQLLTGATGSIILALVQRNCIDETARAIVGLVALPVGSSLGIADDRYRTFYDPLDVALSDLCAAAGLGYDILVDVASKKLVFVVQKGVNRTATQSDTPRVVIDLPRGTAAGVHLTESSSSSKNVFYATEAGYEFPDDAFTQTYITDDHEPQGITRRERHGEYSLSVASAEKFAELRRLALDDAEGYRATKSFTCDMPPGGQYVYRRDYFLGDIVTLRGAGVEMDAPLTEITREWSAAGLSVTAIFGDAPINPLKLISRKVL